MRVSHHTQSTVSLEISNHFCPTKKTLRSPAHPINPMHGNIAVANQQYPNNLYDYPLVKNMNSVLNKIVVAAINDHQNKVAKYMVMEYANKFFVERMDWIYVR